MGITEPSPPCPLCSAPSTFFHRDHLRSYHQCSRCALIHVPPAYYLSPQAEKAQYDLHENDPHDLGYRKFLSRLTAPLLTKLPPRSHGLDYGCGPGPTLSVIMQEAGHSMALHDPIYHPNPDALNNTYQFITATEVFEHLHKPKRDLNTLYRALKPGGWLGIMTKRARDKNAFSAWHYIQDPTHVCFWSETTFKWLADQWQATLSFPTSDAALIQRSR